MSHLLMRLVTRVLLEMFGCVVLKIHISDKILLAKTFNP